MTGKVSNFERTIDASLPLMGNYLLERTGIQPEMLWYGAVYIHPKHCVIRACVKTDSERQLINADTTLLESCKDILFDMGYPQETRPYVLVGCESQETVDRESKGNWWHHFK